MNNFIDLTKQKFGKLVVVKYIGKDKWGQSQWLCKCDCGKEKIILGYCLTRGTTQSCGCWRKEVSAKMHTTHGYKKSRIYGIWRGIITRCTNVNDHGYSNYGGRGIEICKRWRNSFENFLKDMGMYPTNKHQIHRINNNKGYCKENCCWATPKEQMRNTRCNRLITHNGKTQCLAEWAEETEIPYHTLWKRIVKYGWTIEKALTLSVRKYRKVE